MNTEIIRGQTQQTLELVAEIEGLRREQTHMECIADMKDKRITAIEKEKEELQQEKQRIIEGAKKIQEEKMFMTQKYIEASKEVTRMRGLLARNGIKYKKVK
jgi:NADH:ubiquinone oxidoreductase subunit E